MNGAELVSWTQAGQAEPRICHLSPSRELLGRNLDLSTLLDHTPQTSLILTSFLPHLLFPEDYFQPVSPLVFTCSSNSGLPENTKQSEDGVWEFQSTSIWELKVKAFVPWMHSTLRLMNNECTQSPIVAALHNVSFVPELISTTSSEPEATWALSETLMSALTV